MDENNKENPVHERQPVPIGRVKKIIYPIRQEVDPLNQPLSDPHAQAVVDGLREINRQIRAGNTPKEEAQSEAVDVVSEKSNEDYIQNPGRRGIIKKGFMGAVAAIMGLKGVQKLNNMGEKQKVQVQKGTDLASGGQTDSSEKVVPIQIRNQNFQNPSIRNNSTNVQEKITPQTLDEILFPYFANFSPQGQEFIFQKVDGYREKYIKLQSAIQKVESLDTYINQAATALQFGPDKNVLKTVVKGILFVESRGNATAQSAVDARGVAQVMPGTAAEIFPRLQAKLKNDPHYGALLEKPDVFNPEVGVLAGMEYIGQLHDMLVDPALIVWAYHAGQGNIGDLLAAYLLNDKKKFINPQDAEKIRSLQENSPNRTEYLNYVVSTYWNKNEIGTNFADFRMSQTVLDRVKTLELGDKTEEYVFEVAGATAAILQS